MDNTLSLDYQQTDFGREFAEEVERLDGRIDGEIEARSEADNNLQNQIDTIKASSDVVDIVGTKAELDGYDTSKLSDNDIVKVLEDETHDGDITYYRWSTSTEAFSFIGSLSAYYSKGETDNLLSGKQDTLTAGTNIQINDNVISADKDAVTLYAKPQAGYPNRYNFYYEDTFTTMVTRAEMLDMLRAGNVQITRTVRPGMSWIWTIYDVLEDGESTPDTIWFTTSSYNVANPGFVSFSWRNGDDYATYNQFNVYSYSDFTGATSSTAGSHGLVPAPTTSDVDKYLKGDGTWGTISVPTVTLYSDIGQNTDGAMTQKAVSDSLFVNSDRTRIKITDNTSSNNANGDIVIGHSGVAAYTANSIAIGMRGTAAGTSGSTSGSNTAIGMDSVRAIGGNSTALGNFGVTASGNGSTAIGALGVTASAAHSVAIGYGNTFADHSDSVALGSSSTTGRTYELSIGTPADSANPEKTRYIAHVTAGVNDTDAVNKKQLDDAIAGIPSASNINSTDWSGLWQ